MNILRLNMRHVNNTMSNHKQLKNISLYKTNSVEWKVKRKHLNNFLNNLPRFRSHPIILFGVRQWTAYS